MFTFQQVYQAISALILDISDVEEEEITPSSTFEEIEIDSIDYIEMNFMIKKKFQLSIPGELFETQEISNIQGLCDHILNNSPA
jgi:acyl carrier protein